MTEHQLIVELDQDDKQKTIREWSLVVMIVVIGLILALFIGYEINASQQDISAIRCEEGDVTLILERASGELERVECPVEVSVTP